MPIAAPQDLAEAIVDVLRSGARILNLSVGLTDGSGACERGLTEALDYATARGAVIVAAAGNNGAIGSSVITRHPGVIPIVACDPDGKPIPASNLGSSIGCRGLSAPGDHITSLGTNGELVAWGGTSVAAPFVTGAIALLWSLFPYLSAAQVKMAVLQSGARKRRSLIPPLLDGGSAYRSLSAIRYIRGTDGWRHASSPTLLTGL